MADLLDDQQRLILRDLADVGVLMRDVSDINWEQPHPRAIPVLVRWLSEPIDPRLKSAMLATLGYKWAITESAPFVRRLFDDLVYPSDGNFDEFQVSLAYAISRTPAAKLWPDILQIARRSDLGRLRGIMLERAGKFRKHPDEVLDLYAEFVDLDDVYIAAPLLRGLRLLGDPRGVALVHQVKDLTADVLREKAKTLDRLQGREN